MRVVVDRNRCEGNAICTALAPVVFDLDADDIAVVLVDDLLDDQHDDALAAVDACPRAAIVIES